MNIVVCAKAVPDTSEAEIEIAGGGAAIDTEDLVFGINEWDAYAVETALRLKEQHGGHVTVLSLGDEEDEGVVRRALAMGADAGVLVAGEDFEGGDGLGVAKALAAAIRGLDGFDLVLCGAQSSDTGAGVVGPALAELLDVPFAALSLSVQIAGGRATVHRELEANRVEVVDLGLPALVTVQTGTEQPRYVSVLGIRKARRIPIEELDVQDLGLDAEQVGRAASSVATTTLALPEAGGRAEMLQGPLSEVCERAAAIVREALT